MPAYIICLDAKLRQDCIINAEAGKFGDGVEYVTRLDQVQGGDRVIVYSHGTWNDDNQEKTAKAGNSTKVAGKEYDGKALLDYLCDEKGLEKNIPDLGVVLHICHSAGTVEETRTYPKHGRRLSSNLAYDLCVAMKDSYEDVVVTGYQGTMGAGRAGMPAEGVEHLEIEAGTRRGRSASAAASSASAASSSDDKYSMEKHHFAYTVVGGDTSSPSVVVLHSHGENVAWKL